MIKKEIVLHAKVNQRPFSVDVRYVPNGQSKPVVLFVHGFKGFKDAMHFNLIADQVAAAGFVYVKMNLSHNGVTPEHPMDFVDLDAFSNNNFSIELDDIGIVIDAIERNLFGLEEIEFDKNNLILVGHSRGGAVSILKACEDHRVKKLVTWAAVPDLEAFWSEEFLEDWKKNGVQFIKNARTQQDMPMNYQIVEDFENNADRFRISSQLRHLKIPFLAIHGTEDETVPFESLKLLQITYPQLTTLEIEGAGHTFGGKHPWEEPELPLHSQLLVNKMVEFLNPIH